MDFIQQERMYQLTGWGEEEEERTPTAAKRQFIETS
jgi:hypothetical protein